MSRQIQVITSIPQDLAVTFITEKKMEGLDTMPHLHSGIKSCVKKFVQDNIGYESYPIACISRYNGISGELKGIGANVSEFIPTKAGSSLWQLQMPEDMVVS